MLLCLIRHAPETVTKQRLLEEVWPATAVSDDVVWRSISELRRALDDRARSPSYVETVPRRGYRLIAPVSALSAAEADAAPTPGAKSFRGWRRAALGTALGTLSILAAVVVDHLGSAREELAPPRETPRRFASFEAFNAFSKGWFLYRRGTAEDTSRSVSFFTTAVEVDPTSARARAALALALTQAGRLDIAWSADALARAKQEALRAVELDDSSADAHAALGSVLFWREGRWSDAEAELRRAIELEASNADAHRELALILAALGRHREAETEIRTAWRLDDRSLRTNLDSGWIYYFGGRFDAAVEECRHARELFPGLPETRSCLVAAYGQGGRHEEALALIRELAAERHIELDLPQSAAEASAREAFETAVRVLLEAAVEEEASRAIPTLDVARLQMAIGETDRALQRLEEAGSERRSSLAHLSVDPYFHDLRSHPRFQRLLRSLQSSG